MLTFWIILVCQIENTFSQDMLHFVLIIVCKSIGEWKTIGGVEIYRGWKRCSSWFRDVFVVNIRWFRVEGVLQFSTFLDEEAGNILLFSKPSIVWHKATIMRHTAWIKFKNKDLQVQLVNHYTTMKRLCRVVGYLESENWLT